MLGKQHETTATGSEILVPARGAGGGEAQQSQQLEISSSSSRLPVATTGLGRFASAAQTWDAVVSLLVAMVSFVRVEDDIFEQILDLLASPPAAGSRP